MTHHQPAGRPERLRRVGVVLVMGMRAKGAASSWRLLRPVAVAGVLLVVSCTTPGAGDEPNDPARGADAPPSSPVSTSDAPTADDDLLAEALRVLRDMDLPEGPIPEGFIEADRLYGECIASFGFPVSEPELAWRSGVYVFYVGDQEEQFERISKVESACRRALRELGVVMPMGRAAHEARYRAYVDVYECLRAHGYPTSDPPSLEGFLENPDGWTPWKAMIGDADPVLPSPGMKASGVFGPYLESLEVCPRP